jgi:hypothetical protein
MCAPRFNASDGVLHLWDARMLDEDKIPMRNGTKLLFETAIERAHFRSGHRRRDVEFRFW